MDENVKAEINRHLGELKKLKNEEDILSVRESLKELYNKHGMLSYDLDRIEAQINSCLTTLKDFEGK